MNCNSGLISDGLANYGVVGVVIAPILLLFFLHLYDRSSIGLDKRITLASTIYLTIILLNAFLPAVLLTHGLLILIVVLSLLKREESDEGFN